MSRIRGLDLQDPRLPAMPSGHFKPGIHLGHPIAVARVAGQLARAERCHSLPASKVRVSRQDGKLKGWQFTCWSLIANVWQFIVSAKIKQHLSNSLDS